MKKPQYKQDKVKRVQQDMPLADYAFDVLIDNKEPMHVTALTEAMIERGWKPVGSKPSHVVYTNLFGLIQRKGEDAGIKLLGKGVFATERQARGKDAAVVPPHVVKTAIVDGKRIKLNVISNIPEDQRICGNCKFMEYSAAQELYMEHGTCAIDTKSGRVHCPRKADKCPHWEQKSAGQVAKEERRRKTLRLTVLAFNVGVSRSRRSLG